MRLAISGPPGSGKTTVCSLVAEKLGYKVVLVGQVFRQMALERKMDLVAFGKLAEEDETIDRELDDRMVTIAKESGDIVIEGRLAGALLKNMKVPVFAAYIDASEKVRAQRIAQREQKDPETVLREIQARERSERKRYMAYYGIDPSDRQLYDLWIDSSELPPDNIADIIVHEARRKNA